MGTFGTFIVMLRKDLHWKNSINVEISQRIYVAFKTVESRNNDNLFFSPCSCSCWKDSRGWLEVCIRPGCRNGQFCEINITENPYLQEALQHNGTAIQTFNFTHRSDMVIKRESVDSCVLTYGEMLCSVTEGSSNLSRIL